MLCPQNFRGERMDLGGWLRSLGLERYETAFRENEISERVLPKLTQEDLKEIGVGPVGHRRMILEAIAALRIDASGKGPSADIAPMSAPASVSPQDRAERRQVTVMFSDLVGSTALSARLDPEDLREVISSYQKCVAETVGRFGGFVAKYMGDGVLVYFGYPQAHEDDAERAVRAGLELVGAVSSLKTHAPLQTRVGIATGLVVVGDLIGSGASQEQAIVGETPNLAARLQGIAEPNTVVIGEGTRRLLGNLFELEDLGAKDLKGIAGPVRAFAALRASSAEGRFEALHASGLTDLVGREEELELLLRRWSKAKTGEGQVVLLSGEPGIGKSRLTAAVVERLTNEPHTRLRYFCSSHHEDSALYPSITQLERAACFRREDTDEQRLEKLEAVLSQGTNDLSEAVPLLADLLSIPVGDRYPSLNLTPQKRKEKTLHAQLAQIEGLAAQQPVLLVFEDVHWSDPTTRELLDLLIDRVRTLRVLVIITFRPEFTPPWVGRPHVALLSLSRLPPKQRTEMITHVTGGKALPKEIADQIVDRTDGVPLFIEELTKSVVESGLLMDSGDRYTATGPMAQLAIPTSLHASLLARLDRLAPTREVAQIGAALGRQFSHELISVVAQAPQQQVDNALEQLVRAELVYRRGTPPDAEYTFKHALVQDAAYGTLLRSRRQQLHARITTILEAQFPEIVAAQPALLSHHCAEARMIEKAIGYCLKAGHLAIERSAMLEAEAQLSRGLNLLASLPKDIDRRQHELHLQSALIVTLMQTKGYAAPAVAETLARARELCEQLNQPPQFVNVLYVQGGYHILRGELQSACQDADKQLELGKAQNDPVVKSTACFNSAAAWLYRGDFAKARAYAEQVLQLYDTAHSSLYAMISPQDPQSALMFLSCALSCLGHLDQARSRRDEALVKARQRAHPNTLALVLAFAWFHDDSVQTEPALLLERAEELQALCAEHGFPYFAALASVCLGSALSVLGSTEKGLARLTEGLTAYRATGALVSVPNFLRLLADRYRKAGRPKEGLKYLDEAARHIGATQERWTEAEMYRLRGELLIAVGDPVAAEASFRQAIAIARRQSAKLWELRAALTVARFWRDQSKRDEARNILAPVYGWFTEGFDTLDLKEAKALLEELA
jgi:predicted ATPase/class 3 adenylate cyclase